MKLTFPVVALAAFVQGSFAQVVQRDIVVYGGTSGGVAAAVQATRSGKSVVLISPTPHLGGLTSSGLGWTDLGDSSILGGIAREFYQAVYQHYEASSAWNWQTRASFGNAGQGGPAFNATTGIASVFEPRVAEVMFVNLITTAGVEVITGKIDQSAAGITKTGTLISKLRLEDGREYAGKVFIDASYEGDLLPGAGVSFTVGREPNTSQDESFSGIQAARATKNQLPDNIDPYVIAGDAASGLLPGVNADAGGIDGAGDARLQAYCFRMVLTDVAANRVAVAQPPGYAEADYELLFRAIEAGQTGGFFKLDLMPNRKTDSNNSGGISTDFIGKNYGPGWNWTTLTHTQRDALAKQHENWQRGLLWTLQNHTRVPVAIRNNYQNWGLPADEFTDNGNWPWQIYVRESRRMVADVVMSQHHAASVFVARDSIGLAAYAMDSHNVQRHVKNGMVKNEGDVQMPVSQPFPVSYRAITPKRAECTNLLVPWSLSATHMAFGSIRMEPVFMALAQSSAIAAAQAIDANSAVQDVSYATLKPSLLAAGQSLGNSTASLPEFVIDNNQTAFVESTGTWIPSAATPGFAGSDYWHDNNDGKGTKTATFHIPASGLGWNHVWLRWTAATNRATNVPVQISHSAGTASVTINQRENGSTWHYMGLYQITSQTTHGLTLSNTGTDGYVVVDAIGYATIQPTTDSDGDGISDVREAALHLHPFVSNAAFVATLQSNPSLLGLHSPSEIHDVSLRVPYFATAAAGPPLLGIQLTDATAPPVFWQWQIEQDQPRTFYRAALQTAPSRLLQRLQAGQSQKLVVYGTSLTAGGAWVNDLATWATAKATAPGALTVVNSGLSGKSSHEGLAQLATKVIAHQPDTVLIEFGINDAFRYTDGTPQLTVAQARTNLDTIITTLQAQVPGVEIILQTMNTAWDSPTGSNASATLRPNLAAYYENYRQAAKTHGLRLIDHFQQWSTLQTTAPALFQAAIPDGVHPTPTALRKYMLPMVKWKLAGKP